MTVGQYQIVRFTPDPVRGEPLNIGLVMTGDFEARVSFPAEALERASRWSMALDQAFFVSLRDDLESALRRAAARAEDLGAAIGHEIMGEAFGPVGLSEPRWTDLPSGDPLAADRLFAFLLDRLVKPPKPVVYGGGHTASEKLAKEIVLPAVRRVFPNAHQEKLIGRSGREFDADAYAGGSHPAVVTVMAVGSNWQGMRAVEARAFELSDIARTLRDPRMVAVCDFPKLDPEGVAQAASQIFGSIDVTLASPDGVDLAVRRVFAS